jgi:hypothetical protein
VVALSSHGWGAAAQPQVHDARLFLTAIGFSTLAVVFLFYRQNLHQLLILEIFPKQRSWQSLMEPGEPKEAQRLLVGPLPRRAHINAAHAPHIAREILLGRGDDDCNGAAASPNGCCREAWDAATLPTTFSTNAPLIKS